MCAMEHAHYFQAQVGRTVEDEIGAAERFGKGRSPTKWPAVGSQKSNPNNRPKRSWNHSANSREGLTNSLMTHPARGKNHTALDNFRLALDGPVRIRVRGGRHCGNGTTWGKPLGAFPDCSGKPPVAMRTNWARGMRRVTGGGRRFTGGEWRGQFDCRGFHGCEGRFGAGKRSGGDGAGAGLSTIHQ